jgi:3-phenylpropionate/trans-cinnamate dioxygenase ferredoxin reductase subunit
MRCGVGLRDIEGQHAVTHVVATDGTTFEASAVVIGVGLVPDENLARNAEITIGDGIVVDEQCRTSAPGVFAAGDIAYHPNPILGRSFRVEQWQNAQHQGQAAARNMLGLAKPFSEIPWFWSDQYDLDLQMVGMPSASDDVVFRGDVEGRDFSVYYLRDGVLEAVVGINRVLDVRAGRRLVAQRARIAPASLADESIALASFVGAT